jgi:hypothetical protein
VQTGSQVMSVPSAGPVRISLQSGGSAVALVRIAYPFSVMDYVRSVTFADPAAARLSYQTFGWWDGFEGSTAPHAYPDVGGFSVGAATPAGAIPTVGSAVFQGKLAAAVYARTVANPVEVAALMSLSVDFGARAATFSSTDWSDTINGVQPGTALNGRLTYSAAGGPMTGALATANGQYSGPASAQFYGPGAEEVGGAFTLAPANGGGSQVVGGFGAVR